MTERTEKKIDELMGEISHSLRHDCCEITQHSDGSVTVSNPKIRECHRLIRMHKMLDGCIVEG